MNFKELKKIIRKIYFNNIIQQFIRSLSLSLFVEGIFLLIVKIFKFEIIIWLHVLVPVVLFIISFGLLMFFFTPTKKDIYRTIDKEFDLKESLLTKEEFINQDTPILNIQRKEVDERLNRLYAKDYRLSISISLIVIAVLSISLFTTSAVVPNRYEKNNDSVSSEPSIDESSSSESSSVSSSEENSNDSSNDNSSGDENNNSNQDISDILDDLKDKIDNSDLDEETKENLKDQLDKLEENLQNGDKTEEEKNEEIDKTEEDMNQEIEDNKDGQSEETKDNLDDLKQDISNAMDQIKDAMNGQEGEGSQEGEGNQEGEEGGENQGTNGSGTGDGNGENIYAADDLIYDYENDRYVSYGELIEFYYNKVVEGMNDGSLPEDLQDLIAQYFASLYNETNSDSND